MEISSIFWKHYNGHRNFMTPNIIEYGRNGNLVWELSHGEGYRQTPIYGVSVLKHENNRTEKTDLSQMFDSSTKAYQYIKKLK